jgi:hypothetical protein
MLQVAVQAVGPVFPEPGDYRGRLIIRNDILAERRLVVRPFAPPGQAGEN